MHIIKCLSFGNLFGLYIFHHISICFISIFSQWMSTVHIFRIKTKKRSLTKFNSVILLLLQLVGQCPSGDTPVINIICTDFLYRSLEFDLHLSACICVFSLFKKTNLLVSAVNCVNILFISTEHGRVYGVLFPQEPLLVKELGINLTSIKKVKSTAES